LKVITAFTSLISKYLPVWIILCSIIAYILPDLFFSIQGLTGPSLGFIFLQT